MSDYQYPSGDDISEAEEQIEDILGNEFIQKLETVKASSKSGVVVSSSEFELPESFTIGKNYNMAFGRNSQSIVLEDFTYDRPYKVDDFGRMMVCRTFEFNPQTQSVDMIEANPNDISHFCDAMINLAGVDSRVTGILGIAQASKSTTGFSMVFANKAMEAEYENRGLRANVMSTPANKGISFVKGNFNEELTYTYAFLKGHEDFHRLFKENTLIQMNHRLTQEAIEKNRSFFPSGDQLSMEDRLGFNFNRIAQEAARDAFERTKIQIDMMKNFEIARDKSQVYRKEFIEKLKPKIINDNFVETFGKAFKPRKGESENDAVTRIRKEYKDFSKAKFEELEGKGLPLILAQGLARGRGMATVTADHINEAQEIFKKAKNDPVQFRSTERIIKQVSGEDKELTKALMHNLDGRSTFQRSHKTLERYGAHLSAHHDDRTRIRAEDRESGGAFAASALMGVPPSDLASSMTLAMKDRGYSAEGAVKARDKMLKSIGKLKNSNGEPVAKPELREHILENAASKATRKLAREERDQRKGGDEEGQQSKPEEPKDEPDKGMDDDYEGPEPGDPSGSRKRRRR